MLRAGKSYYTIVETKVGDLGVMTSDLVVGVAYDRF